MKKLFLVALLGLAFSVSMSAQFFVGGQVSVNTASNTNKNVNPAVTASNTTVSILPNLGYKINDDMCVGGRVGLEFGSAGPNNSTFGFGIQPYFRYTVLTFGHFSVAAEANVGITTRTVTNRTPQVATARQSNFDFALGAVPVLLYQLNKHITLEANISVLNLNLSFGSIKGTNTPEGGNPVTTQDQSTFNFGLGANTNSVFANGLGAVTLGFTYAF